MAKELPPGQRWRADFPRFGLDPFVHRRPDKSGTTDLKISHHDGTSISLDLTSAGIEPVELHADFHCVTTWSYPDLYWQGYRLTDLIKTLETRYGFVLDSEYAVFRCLDGYRCKMLMQDLLSDDVLIATHLNGSPLDLDHGTALRLIAPNHYGYKNAKYLTELRFETDPSQYRFMAASFLEHERGRVAMEERGKWLPGWFYRFLYRPLIEATVRKFKQAYPD